MNTQDEIDARFRAIAPDPTVKLDDKFLVARVLMQEVAALREENTRFQVALLSIAKHTIDETYFDTLTGWEIATDCRVAYDDVVAIARAALDAPEGQGE